MAPIGLSMAAYPEDLLSSRLFEFIQKYTGYISPAIFPVFLLGFFWKRTSSNAAITGIIVGVILSIVFDKFMVAWAGNETILYTAYANGRGGFEIPYLIQMGWVFVFTFITIVLVSILDKKGHTQEHKLQEDKNQYALSNANIAMVIIVLGLVAAMYIRFW